MNLRDLAERTFWTAFVAGVGNTSLAALLDVDQLKAAAMTAGSAALTVVVVFARKRLSVLPDPGAGLPGLPTGNR